MELRQGDGVSDMKRRRVSDMKRGQWLSEVQE